MSNGKLGSDESIAVEVIKKAAKDWLPDTYLTFTFYAIQHRALVGTDGLKPVQRRILWSMFNKGITPNSEHMKAARCAADAVAYHPHGSASVEDALARLAQKFSLRVPLIDPYGSVGTVTGDIAAAARYWEARLTPAAMELVKETKMGAVKIGKNFDGKLDEPSKLPVRWPVDIINGTEGIAVGYASKMYSHNPDEVIEACRAILKSPNMQMRTLLKLMPGPDLATGGELFGTDGVEEYYKTGKGSFTVRARYNVENLKRGKVKIVFYELPYQVSAEAVIEKVHTAQQEKKFKEIASIKDLTDMKNGMRLVVETKAGTNHLNVLNELFKITPLEQKFSVNQTVLVDNSPVQVGTMDLLKNFVEFRKLCTVNMAEARIKQIEHRMHQLAAILAVLIDLDKCIAIIRNSDTVEKARQDLMKTFKIDEEQAEYILSMQLRRLTRADNLAVEKENNDLTAELAEMNLILTDEATLVKTVDRQLAETKKVISDPRRTVISGVTTDELKEQQKAMVKAAKEVSKPAPCYVTRFANGKLVKTEKPFAYTSNTLQKYKNSPIIEQIRMNTQDDIVIIGSDGLGRRIPVSYLAEGVVSRPQDMGVTLPKDVRLVGFCKSEYMKSDIGLAILTNRGGMKISKNDFPKGDEFEVVKLASDETVTDTRWIGKTLSKTFFAIFSKHGNIALFDASQIRVSGSKAGTIRAMNIKDSDDEAIALSWIDDIKDPEVRIITQGEKTISMTPITEIVPKNRGGLGVVIHNFTKGETKLLNAFAGTKLIASLKDGNNAVNLPPASKRTARGVDFGLEVHFGSYEM